MLTDGTTKSPEEGIVQKSLESLKLWNKQICKRQYQPFLKKIDAPVDTQNIEASHRLKSDDNGRNNQAIVKFSKREDMFRPMNKNGP